MKPAQIANILLSFLVTLPIWYYLVYVMLSAAHPDRLVWFLFWTYVPVGLFCRVLSELTTPSQKSERGK